MNLYELAGQYRELADLDELDPETLADTIEGLDGLFEDKASNLVRVIQERKARVTAIDSEVKRLQAKKSTENNAVDRLRAYLLDGMQAAKKTKIATDIATITVTKPRKVVVITDELKLSDNLIRTKREPNKTLIAEALDNGPVDGAEYGESAASLRIA